MAEQRVKPKQLIAVLAALMFFYGMLIAGMQLVIADAATSFGTNETGMGLLVSSQYFSAVAMPVLMGILADKIGKKKVLCLFAAVFSLGCLAAGLSSSVIGYVAGALLIGAGYSVCESECCAVLFDLDKDKSARSINLTQGMLCVGAVISPILVQFLQARLNASWRVIYFVCSAAFALLCVLLILLRFPAPTASGPKQEGSLLFFFKSSVFVAAFAAMILYVGLENGFGYFVDSLFVERVSGSGAAALSLYWAGMALSRVVFSAWNYKARPVLIACFAAIGMIHIGLTFASQAWLMLVLSALTGIAYGPIWSTLAAEAAAEFPDRAASATGLISTACAIGGIVYPLLMGMTVEKLSITPAIALLAVTAFLAALCSLKLRKER